MIKHFCLWITLIAFTTQSTFAQVPKPIPADVLDKALTSAVDRLRSMKTIAEIDEPYLKTAIARAKLPATQPMPRVSRSGNVFRLDTGGKTASLEFVDIPARLIKVDGKSVTLSGYETTATLPDVLKMFNRKSSLSQVLDFLVPDAHADVLGDAALKGLESGAGGGGSMSTALILMVVVIVFILYVIGIVLLWQYILNRPVSPPPRTK